MFDYKKRYGKAASFYLNDLQSISEEQAEMLIMPLVKILYRLNISFPKILGYEIFDKAVHIIEDKNKYELVFIRQIRKNYFFKIFKSWRYYQCYLKIDINKNKGVLQYIDNIDNFKYYVQDSKIEGMEFIPKYTLSAINNNMAKDILLLCLRVSSFSNELIQYYSGTNENIKNTFKF